jgi:hypothetical protein
MAKTPEQVLREIIAEQIFQLATLASKVDELAEELKAYKTKFGEMTDGSKQDV